MISGTSTGLPILGKQWGEGIHCCDTEGINWGKWRAKKKKNQCPILLTLDPCIFVHLCTLSLMRTKQSKETWPLHLRMVFSPWKDTCFTHKCNFQRLIKMINKKRSHQESQWPWWSIRQWRSQPFMFMAVLTSPEHLRASCCFLMNTGGLTY